MSQITSYNNFDERFRVKVFLKAVLFPVCFPDFGVWLESRSRQQRPVWVDSKIRIICTWTCISKRSKIIRRHLYVTPVHRTGNVDGYLRVTIRKETGRSTAMESKSYDNKDGTWRNKRGVPTLTSSDSSQPEKDSFFGSKPIFTEHFIEPVNNETYLLVHQRHHGCFCHRL